MRIKKSEIELLDKYFRAANYISACQLYLLDNPLLKRKLELKDIKKKLVGHWGTVPGQNFVYTHLNRVINKYNLNMIYISGPGHGGNSPVANTYLEGSYTELYPNITEDEEGLKKLFKQFSFPGGISSHAAPETPGSINEGGELGYSLSHAYGAALDNKDLIVACVVGDGEAETGPLATSWHINKFINPVKDGCVLPILHLNGYKISNPTILSRISENELISLFVGYGYQPLIVAGKTNEELHKNMASKLDYAINKIKQIQYNARVKKSKIRPIWPMIILKTPKGWSGPKEVDGIKIENTFRAHQIPIKIENEKELKELENWLRSYKPEELFDKNGKLKHEIKKLCPKGNKRMGSNPITNGGMLLNELNLPDYRNYKVETEHGKAIEQDMMVLGKYLSEVVKLNNNNFRIFSPDEALSNRLNYVFDETNRQFCASIKKNDEYLNQEGRVIDSFLSEHVCEGLLEGYLLTGRHGLFASYEAFARVVDSMSSQHAKWLKVTNEIPWRAPIASLNYILTSHIWQQDHNGYTHQEPGFLSQLASKKSEIVRMYLPPDANCLLSCMDHCLKSKHYINVIVASKHPTHQWLNIDEAIEHCKKGVSTWEWASNDKGKPDIVFASCGDTPTIEVLAASKLLRELCPKIKVRVVNVVDLMKLASNEKHPHGLTDEEFDNLFTKNKPVIFAFHGYPTLIHELIYKRNNNNIHVHGYIEEGTITTSFDMRVQNKIDRYNLILSALKYINVANEEEIISYCLKKLKEHKSYIKRYGVDIPEITNWTFNE